MNHLLSIRSAIATTLVVCAAVTAQAQIVGSPLNTATVLNGHVRCDHVLRLIHRHGVNNSVDQALGNSLLHQTPLGGVAIPDAELGDLEIVQVSQVVHEDEACGPRIAVVVRNNSCRKVCNFHITGVAMLGRILPISPNVTVKVAEILPEAALEIQLQLPIEALAMGNRNGQIIGFQRLVVAIDSYDELLETNEANNLRAWNRAEIPVAEATVVETAAETATETVATEVAETSQVQSAEPTDGSTDTVVPQTQSPDALRKAIEQIGTDDSNADPASNA